jgi:hypothetical protein
MLRRIAAAVNLNTQTHRPDRPGFSRDGGAVLDRPADGV